ncbi:MAG: hypothetical protein KJP14_03965 [Eudoraea sp.]|nr:hypothetical protein [Eudoraea sp.]
MEQDLNNKNKQYPEGHFLGLWMGIGIALFSGLGVVISAVMENYAFIGMGPAIGVAVGLPIGQAIENKHKEQGRIRPLIEKEKKARKNILYIGLALFLLGVVVFTLMYFMA